MQLTLPCRAARSDLCLPLQGVLGFQDLEYHMQLLTQYMASVSDPVLPAHMLYEAARSWEMVQGVLLSLGPTAYWTQRRTMLVATMLQMQATWMHAQCQASSAVCMCCCVFSVALQLLLTAACCLG